MRYTPHGLERYKERQARTEYFAQTGTFVYALLLGAVFGPPVFAGNFEALVPAAVLFVAFFITKEASRKAERQRMSSHFERYGQPQLLSLSQSGFHFEIDVPYSAKLLGETPTDEDGVDYIYLIEKLGTKEHYVVYSWMKLPYEKFTYEFKDNTYTFTQYTEVMH